MQAKKRDGFAEEIPCWEPHDERRFSQKKKANLAAKVRDNVEDFKSMGGRKGLVSGVR